MRLKLEVYKPFYLKLKASLIELIARHCWCCRDSIANCSLVFLLSRLYPCKSTCCLLKNNNLEWTEVSNEVRITLAPILSR